MDPKMVPPIAAPMIGPGEEAIIIRRKLVKYFYSKLKISRKKQFK